MPFLGLATQHDLEKLRHDMNSCTQIVNGVTVCSEPMYEQVVDVDDFGPKDLKQNTCVKVDHIPDGKGGSGEKFPVNYLCYDSSKLMSYANAAMKTAEPQQVHNAIKKMAATHK